MIALSNLEKNIKNMEKYVDVKNDKLSSVLKFFYADMVALDMLNFTKSEQVKIFEKAFGRDIIYITYISIFNRLSKDKSITEMFNKNGEFDIESEVKKVDTLPSKKWVENEDKKAISDDSKKESNEEKRVRRNKALMNLENNDVTASEFDEFK